MKDHLEGSSRRLTTKRLFHSERKKKGQDFRLYSSLENLQTAEFAKVEQTVCVAANCWTHLNSYSALYLKALSQFLWSNTSRV